MKNRINRALNKSIWCDVSAIEITEDLVKGKVFLYIQKSNVCNYYGMWIIMVCVTTKISRPGYYDLCHYYDLCKHSYYDLCHYYDLCFSFHTYQWYVSYVLSAVCGMCMKILTYEMCADIS